MKHYNKKTAQFIYENYIENKQGTFFLDVLTKIQKAGLGILEVVEPKYNPEYQYLVYEEKDGVYQGIVKDKISKTQYELGKIIEEFKRVVQEKLDSKAQEHGYDSIVSAASYAGYENDFRAEGEAFGLWRAKCWTWGYALLAKYKDIPIEQIPSIEEMLKTMPEYIAPASET